MGTAVIVCYRAKPGQEAALLALLGRHVSYLQAEGLATDRPATLLRAADGTYLEIFEWQPGALDKAQDHAGVRDLWAEFERACEYLPLSALIEADKLFPAFALVDPVPG